MTNLIVMGEVKSDWVDVSSGVPQRSALGPLLFVLYINELQDRISNKIKPFADDWEDAIRLQDNLSSICQWSEDRTMYLWMKRM